MSRERVDLIELPAASPEEVRAVTAFLAAAFGWTFTDYGGEYSDTRDGGLAVGVNGSTAKEQVAPLAVLHTDDIADAKRRVEAAGGVVTHDVTAFPGGVRFAFRDPAGNQLAIWSEQ